MPETHEPRAQELVLLKELIRDKGEYPGDIETHPAKAKILALSPEDRARLCLALASRWENGRHPNMARMLTLLLKENLPFTGASFGCFLRLLLENSDPEFYPCTYWPVAGIRKQLSIFKTAGQLEGDLNVAAQQVLARMKLTTEFRKETAAFDKLLEVPIPVPETECEWTERVHQDLRAMPEEGAERWTEFLTFARTASASQPSRKWMIEAGKRLQPEGDAAGVQIERWLRAFNSTSDDHSERDQNMIKGLVWAASLWPTGSMLRCVAATAQGAMKTVDRLDTHIGAQFAYTLRVNRSPRVASGAFWTLSQSKGGIALLSRLKGQIKQRPTLKILNKYLDDAAASLGVTQEDLTEIAVPGFGFKGNELRHEFGGARIEARLNNGEVVTEWFNKAGKGVKSVPAEVKSEFGAEWKALKAELDAVSPTLLAIRDVLDEAIRTERSWRFGDWVERYRDNPILTHQAERLIWKFEGRADSVAALPVGDGFVGLEGETVSVPEDGTVALWHPILATVAEVLGWRRLLEERGVRQPFKQAHREVYVLTAAERETRTYSNRFAAHLLRQHQFQRMCVARGWRYSLRGGWDNAANALAKKSLGNFDAEFLIADGPEAMADSGILLYIGTDQVRFYNRGEREPLPLEAVPPLVFSEIMRDVDLFCGVCSVGNDPVWLDGGPGQQYRDYWNRFAFGNLGESAQTRKTVIEGLLPRLKIAQQCEVDGKFLKVRGKCRTYKIHFGSGNILMEPNDEYLCIVPDLKAAGGKDLFLPFEGDGLLSVILSKAFLLAEDEKIKDQSILSQIRE